jgi:hypothetical protein
MRAAALTYAGDHWAVAFLPRLALRRAAWWQGLLSPWRHVFAFRAATAEATETVNHIGSRLDLSVLFMPAGDFAAQLLADGATLLAVEADTAPDSAMLRGPMTCVEVTKALLGCRHHLVLTPRALHRHLLRHGAQPVLPNQP